LYNWSGSGVTGDGPSAHVSSGGLDPGTYTVKGEVQEGKRGKEGRKPEQVATCSASFKVKEFEPPTLSCAASPTTLPPGASSDISCTGVSPQDRPLTYDYSASTGTISGVGTVAVFSATGSPTGPVTVKCNVQDDKNHSTTAEVALNIEPPPPPPAPHVQELCGLSFERDTKRPTRITNEAKACLDEIALNLQARPDAKLVFVADSTAKEKEATKGQGKRAKHFNKSIIQHFAEQRGVNAKDYLVREKGVDSSRIAITVGTGDDQNVRNYLVPAGANFLTDVQGSLFVNEAAFTPEERKSLPIRHGTGRPAE